MGTHTSRENTIEGKDDLIKHIKNENYSESMRKGLIELVVADAAEKEAAAKEKAAKKKAAKEKTAKKTVVIKNYSEKEKFHAIKDYLKSLLNHPGLEEKDNTKILDLIILMDQLNREIEEIDKSQTEKNSAYAHANQAVYEIASAGIDSAFDDISKILIAVEQQALKQKTLEQKTLEQQALKQELDAVEKETGLKLSTTFSEKGESFGARPNLTSQENHTAKTETAVTVALNSIVLQLAEYNFTLQKERDKETNSCSFFTFDAVKFAFGKHYTQKKAASGQLSLWIKALHAGKNGPNLCSDDQKALKDGRLGTIAKNLAELCPEFNAALNAKPIAQTAPARK